MMGMPAHQQEIKACEACSGQKAAQARIKYSDLPPLVKPFDSFDASLVENGDKALQLCRDFAERKIGEHFLTLHGNPGVGKTHLLQATAKHILETDGLVVKYIYTPRFLDLLRKTYDQKAEHDYAHIFSQYESAEMLVLDDLGAGRYTEWGMEQVEKLVEARYQDHKMTAFGSNLGTADMAEVLGFRVADRVFDFGSGAAQVVWMGGPSYRTRANWSGR